MRRISSALAPLAAAGALAFAVPGSAYAANGFIVIDGIVHTNPSGCIEVPKLSSVFNVTDIPVKVHNVPGCVGGIVQIIPPGLAVQVPGTHSLFLG